MTLETTKDQVLHILEALPRTRNSDTALFEVVHARYYGITPATPYNVVLKKIERGEIPPFESMRRARQKIQAERIDLRAVEPIETARIEKQAEFIEFASK